MGGITYLGKRESNAGAVAAWVLTYAILFGIVAWLVVSVVCAKAAGGQMEEWNLLKILMDMTEGHRW
jgi:hypothetical protein